MKPFRHVPEVEHAPVGGERLETFSEPFCTNTILADGNLRPGKDVAEQDCVVDVDVGHGISFHVCSVILLHVFLNWDV